MADFVALLAGEGLVTFLAEDGWLCERWFRDDAGNDVWSDNLIVGDEDRTYVDDHVPLLPTGSGVCFRA